MCVIHLRFIIAFLAFSPCLAVDVTTKYGVVRGQTLELDTGVRVNSFLGIPFAKPPVGVLRWKVGTLRTVVCNYFKQWILPISFSKIGIIFSKNCMMDVLDNLKYISVV